MTVNHHVDYVDAERHRAVVDEYVALERLLDLAVEAQKTLENGERRKKAAPRTLFGLDHHHIRDAAKETVPLALRLDAVLELGDWGASFCNVVIKVTSDAVGVAVAQVTGKAMSPAEADHLATWPTRASLQYGAIYLLDDFRGRGHQAGHAPSSASPGVAEPIKRR
ncbi:hypothetical protein [Streptomyces smyrnaeus]|uniref:hypothetical protein n=1 Tax=Streptomyces smyrnaeus TaxID=1387713 RepID=UPI0036B25C00